MTPLLRETASQTAGPYVHIGLAPRAAGFDIFEKDFGNVLTTPRTQGERITLEGHRGTEPVAQARLDQRLCEATVGQVVR